MAQINATGYRTGTVGAADIARYLRVVETAGLMVIAGVNVVADGIAEPGLKGDNLIGELMSYKACDQGGLGSFKVVVDESLGVTVGQTLYGIADGLVSDVDPTGIVDRYKAQEAVTTGAGETAVIEATLLTPRAIV